MDTLPLEIIIEIATWDIQAYRGLVLSCARFARWTALVTIYEPMSWFGYDVRVVQNPWNDWSPGAMILNHYTVPSIAETGVVWYRDGKKHARNRPAVTCSQCIIWYCNGERHRTDGPAYMSDLETSWYSNGLYHRDDGPAVMHDNNQHWYQHGERHRADGPAIVCPNGSEEWWFNGELHRKNGPALVYADGRCEWYQHGKLIQTQPAQ